MNDLLTKPVLAAMLAETAKRWTALRGGDDEAFSSSNLAQMYQPDHGAPEPGAVTGQMTRGSPRAAARRIGRAAVFLNRRVIQ